MFRIFGVPEEDGEKVEELAIKVIKDEIDVILENEDLDIVHRTGRHRDDGKPRPILVKCMSHKSKVRVMKNKKKAKNVTVHEEEDKEELHIPLGVIVGIIKEFNVKKEKIINMVNCEDWPCNQTFGIFFQLKVL